MTARPSLDTTMLQVAAVLAQRATCAKLSVGCVLVDADGRILGTGYNGVPTGMSHCTDRHCPGVHAPKGADLCEAVHAEQNALLQCRDVSRIHTCYVTHVPCLRCMKTLLNTSCSRIIASDITNAEFAALDLWARAGRSFALNVSPKA
jgi:dCMP deaminase